MPIRIMPAAQRDLRRIVVVYPTNGRRLTRRIRRVCREVLGRHPLVGEACEIVGPGVRRFCVDDFVIYFRSDPREVLRIYHGSEEHERKARTTIGE